MASEVKFHASELLEVDICDAEDTLVNSEDFSGFQQWTSSYEAPGDAPSSPAPLQEVPAGSVFSSCDPEVRAPRTSIVDRLLVELYETYSGGRRNVDSWDSSTEASGPDAFLGRCNTGSSFLQELQEKHTRRHQVHYLDQKAPEELRAIIQEVKYRTGVQSAKLIRQLKRRDRLIHKLHKNYDIVTACLQAVSQKRRVDTRLKFTIEPSVGKNGFQQWYDALKAVARLPTGIPKEWRKRVWLTLADQYLHSISIDWDKTLRFAFNERSNPDDDSLGIQIVKDLHRTGCSSYCGQEGEQDRVVLKRVLLAYARWNKTVGYCQGFNVLAALILEVTEGDESDALKVMIYLIDKVLPESYFANNLRALSVDMAVFRDLLRVKLPRLSQHLHHLQKAANREAGGSYEPPLTNVFTMQWFLTMFATCLPAATVLKIWDSVFFEGSEVLFRVALAIWETLGERIMYCQTADEFYSTMGCLTQEMLDHNLIHPPELIQEVYGMATFPFPQLAELREKYTYNITPFPTSVKPNGSNHGGRESDDDDVDLAGEDSMMTALGCLGPLGGLLAPELQRYQKHLKDQQAERGNIAELSPGAVGGAGGGARAEHQAAINSMMMERMSTDISALKKQYARITRRQQQQAMQLCIRTDKCPATRVLASQLNPSSTVINHLLLGRKPIAAPWASTSTLPGIRPAPLSQTRGSPCRQRCGSLPSNSSVSSGSSGGGAGSPWRAHVRVHRRNVARARAQLGFGDSEEVDEENVETEECRGGEGFAEGSVSSESSPPGPACEDAQQNVPDVTEVWEVEVQLDSMGLEDKPTNMTSDTQPVPLPPPPSSIRHKDSSGSESSDRHFPAIAPPPPHTCVTSSSPSTLSPSLSPVSTLASAEPSSSPTPPSTPPQSSAHHPTSATPHQGSSFYNTPSPSTPSLSSVGSSSRSYIPASPSTPSFTSATTTTKVQVFSPFPCVKMPRKSAAARNLGLYGPTSRTPTVHFPQLSRNCSSTTSTTRRR
ncbi:TBC1 domain family member 30 isoform X4 [Dunckerocampus dactyliophorus]|uniref:TBC1 domain family member 30 isoform X4 n=1 Tax=Dunckerocampus dactyliophorus TaxID=161453 RepID=UPI0024060117|nr:TBC1 domain family member 30 isoform X4 [Dunckerocampus dactyliophorus]